MRLSVTLTRQGERFALQLLPAQRVAVGAAVEVVSSLRSSELVLEVQFGAPRQKLIDTGNRVNSPAVSIVTRDDLQAIYQLLRTLPECFSSEEAFHVRTGYYKENFIGLSKGVLDAVGKCSQDHVAVPDADDGKGGS
ncbi:hypothetical protein ACFVHS_46315 [Streptomyces sp. NPDC057746]|uniref:hypothetical protein n=1 Tax=Streptomyces sp. NPDC057746 TaxID=3346237 RepID=UPI00367EC130